jgi:hypothetical protein
MSRLFSIVNEHVHFQTQTKFFFSEPCVRVLIFAIFICAILLD